jgi:hypothetical protein
MSHWFVPCNATCDFARHVPQVIYSCESVCVVLLNLIAVCDFRDKGTMYRNYKRDVALVHDSAYDMIMSLTNFPFIN